MNKSQRLLLVMSAVVVALMVVGAVSFVRYARRNAPNPRLVAVAPFDIFVPGLEPWRVRLAEGLTQQIAGMPPLETVPQSVVRERWRGADRPEIAAVELARRTSAGAAIYGRLDPVAGNSDSVRAQLIVIDARSTRVLFGIVRRWPAADLQSLAPALAALVRDNYRYPGD